MAYMPFGNLVYRSFLPVIMIFLWAVQRILMMFWPLHGKPVKAVLRQKTLCLILNENLTKVFLLTTNLATSKKDKLKLEIIPKTTLPLFIICYPDKLREECVPLYGWLAQYGIQHGWMRVSRTLAIWPIKVNLCLMRKENN